MQFSREDQASISQWAGIDTAERGHDSFFMLEVKILASKILTKERSYQEYGHEYHMILIFSPRQKLWHHPHRIHYTKSIIQLSGNSSCRKIKVNPISINFTNWRWHNLLNNKSPTSIRKLTDIFNDGRNRVSHAITHRFE